MQQVLSEFIHALRQAGVDVSPAETLDALRTLRLVGLQDRARLKASLGLVLAKSYAHKLSYASVFEQFFRSLETAAPAGGMARDEEAVASETSQPLMPQSPLGQLLLSDKGTDLALAIATAGREEGVNRIQVFTQKSRYSYAILQRLGMDTLNRELAQWIRELEAGAQPQSPALQATARQLALRRQQLVEQVRDYVEQQYLLFAQQKGQRLQEAALRKVKLSHLDLQHYQRMTELVQKAARQLATQHGRTRKTAKRGLLDVRKTLAANAAFDGVQFHMRWKATRVERPKVVAICDVSGSVSRVARFLLLFLYSLQDVLPRVRSFVFTSALTEVTDCFARQGLEAALAEVIGTWGNMPTDYGRALKDLQRNLLRDIDRKTTVIMLGDARNNNGDGNVGVWEQVYRRSRRVVWLNPEARVSWNSGDSIMREYAPYCSVLEPCQSLQDLSRILGRLLKHG